MCLAIYASPVLSIRSSLWGYLTNLCRDLGRHWLVVGDFNEVCLESELKGCSFIPSRANLFSDCLNYCGLVDLHVVGGKYTWQSSIQGKPTMFKRLDRAVVDAEWRFLCPNAFVEVLPRIYSDHHPLLLRCEGLPATTGMRPFQFEATWVTHQDFPEIVS